MTELFILLIATLLLAALFLFWALGQRGVGVEPPPAQVAHLVELVPLSGVSYKRAERIFDPGDYRFLAAQPALKEAARELERDRRRAALLWLKLMREDFDKLQQLHRLLVACGARTSPRAEWALLMNSVQFVLLRGLLALWIRVFGLYATPRAHTALVGSAREVSSHVACTLARLSAGQLAEVKEKWAFRGAAPQHP